MGSSTQCLSYRPETSRDGVAAYLAGILRLRGHDPNDRIPRDWLQEQCRAILHSARGESLLPRRRHALLPFCKTRHYYYPSLDCPGHSELNASLLNRFAKVLRQECAIYFKPYTSLGVVKDWVLEGETRRVALRLSSVLTLFGLPDPGASSPYVPKDCPPPRVNYHRDLRRVKSRCPGCILAVVGGRRDILVALHASLSAHEMAAAGRETSSLLRPLVDAWVEGYGNEEAGEMVEESRASVERMVEDWRYWGTRK